MIDFSFHHTVGYYASSEVSNVMKTIWVWISWTCGENNTWWILVNKYFGLIATIVIIPDGWEDTPRDLVRGITHSLFKFHPGSTFHSCLNLKISTGRGWICCQLPSTSWFLTRVHSSFSAHPKPSLPWAPSEPWSCLPEPGAHRP